MRYALLVTTLVAAAGLRSLASPRRCSGRECTITVGRETAGRGKGTATIAGHISASFVSGVPGGGTHSLEIEPCDVTAIDDHGKEFHGKAKRGGAYSIAVPAGTYQVVFDACVGCAIGNVPDASVSAGATRTVDAGCITYGK